MYKASNKTLILIRGNSAYYDLNVEYDTGDSYTNTGTDTFRFIVSDGSDVLVDKDIDLDSMQVVLEPEDTLNLNPGNYKYEVTYEDGTGYIDTFIQGKLKIKERYELANAKLDYYKEG